MFMIYGKSVEMLVEFLWKFYSKYGYFCEEIWKTKISKWKHCLHMYNKGRGFIGYPKGRNRDIKLVN